MRDDDLADAAPVHPQRGGRGAGPFDCLARAARHQDPAPPHAAHDENGREIAAWLAERLGDENVIYPGLPSHPQHELAKPPDVAASAA